MCFVKKEAEYLGTSGPRKI